MRIGSMEKDGFIITVFMQASELTTRVASAGDALDLVIDAQRLGQRVIVLGQSGEAIAISDLRELASL